MVEALVEAFARNGITEIEICRDPEVALGHVTRIYDASIERLKAAFRAYAEDGVVPSGLSACYPFVGIKIDAETLNVDARLAYGALHDPGLYGTTLTRPGLFGGYYRTQFSMLLRHHLVPLVIGRSQRPIPLPFVVDVAASGINGERAHKLAHRFPMPDLAATDDSIANGTFRSRPGEPGALALFSAERVDYSLHRLSHYTGTSPRYFQRFVLLTNYQRYVDHFIAHAERELEAGDEYDRFVEPGNVVTVNPRFPNGAEAGLAPAHLPQMPAYHLTRPDGRGVTLVNIGVGPPNARTITDHLAVLRPHCWLMLGHCAGLRRTQRLGDYVLAHGYVREDHVLDQEVPTFVPVPPIAEVQVALQQAVANLTGLADLDLKSRMRTGTVVSTANRNWELRYDEFFQRLNQSRAIALDMESATIAANGLRFRVPYGTLLCVSDKPLHGELKLKGMANRFYEERVNQHLEIGLETIRLLREDGADRLHSRKLRSFDEPAFR